MPIAQIFPETSLASSVITTVWIGVMVVAFFNIYFGWVLSGLVVPGYLIPLFIIKPWSALIILFEGICAYLLVYYFSERLSRFGWWSSLFGRDRFFALILASVIARLFFDGWALPLLGEQLEAWGYAIDYRNNLHSFGLVIVALVANQFWKTGVIRGLPPFLVILLITYLIVRYGLMEFTNFGLGAVNYLYDDIASSILSAPKAYIVLIITAFIASKMNLRYGWDFNGIILPALIALQWYDPSKILFSFVESFIILGLATLALKTPVLSKVTIEGAYKLLLFFNIGFLYKIALGYVFYYYFPQYQATQYFAFGYLLSTLLAIKMHSSSITIRLTRATIQTSLFAVFIASIVGYSISLLPSQFQVQRVQEQNIQIIHSPLSLDERVNSLLVQLYDSDTELSAQTPLPNELEAFRAALENLVQLRNAQPSEQLALMLSLLHRAGYVVELIEQRYLLLRPAQKQSSWSTFIVDLQASQSLALELPKPLEARQLIENSLVLLRHLNARSLAIAGNNEISADLVDKKNSFFHAFHVFTARHDTLQIRRQNSQLRAQIPPDKDIENSSLWVASTLPASLDLTRLNRIVGRFNVIWQAAPERNLQRESSPRGFAELFLEKASRRRLVFAALALQADNGAMARHEQQPGGLATRLAPELPWIAAAGSEQFALAQPAQLKYIDVEVITPLVHLAQQAHSTSAGEIDEELENIATAAQVVGYQLLGYRNTVSQQRYAVLLEQHVPQRRHWGSYAFKLGSAFNPLQVQIPKPLQESQSADLGLYLFDALDADFLLLAGAHPLARQDRASDLSYSEAPPSMFDLVNEVILREAQQAAVLQVRALYADATHQANPPDAVFASLDGQRDPSRLAPPLAQALTQLQRWGWQIQAQDGRSEFSAYQIGFNRQARYAEAVGELPFIQLWVSSELRRRFDRDQGGRDISELEQATGLRLEHSALLPMLAQARWQTQPLAREMRELLQRYSHSGDINALSEALRRAKDYRVRLVQAAENQQIYLVLSHTGALDSSARPRATEDRPGRLAVQALMNLEAVHPGSRMLLKADSADEDLRTYLRLRLHWLESAP